jgi:hypothetical protein
MLPPSAVSHEVTEDGWVVLTFLASPEPPGTVPIGRLHFFETGPPEPPRVLGSLAVHYGRTDPDDPSSPLERADRVSLYLPEGITAATLRRFAWSRWLEVADAIARSGGDLGPPNWWGPEPGTAGAKLLKAVFAQQGLRVNLRKRPGRKGHPREFYEEVAGRYLELRRRGERAPTKKIAEERQYSRNTVAGWVRKARQLGLLPPARRGRAG